MPAATPPPADLLTRFLELSDELRRADDTYAEASAAWNETRAALERASKAREDAARALVELARQYPAARPDGHTPDELLDLAAGERELPSAPAAIGA